MDFLSHRKPEPLVCFYSPKDHRKNGVLAHGQGHDYGHVPSTSMSKYVYFHVHFMFMNTSLFVYMFMFMFMLDMYVNMFSCVHVTIQKQFSREIYNGFASGDRNAYMFILARA
jgi:hypothetical protein